MVDARIKVMVQIEFHYNLHKRSIKAYMAYLSAYKTRKEMHISILKEWEKWV